MKILEGKSIKDQVTLILGMILSISIGLSTAALIGLSLNSAQKDLNDYTARMHDFLAQDFVRILILDNPEHAAEFNRRMQALENVRKIILKESWSKNPAYLYQRQGIVDSNQWPEFSAPISGFNDGSYILAQEIIYSDSVQGVAYIEIDATEYHATLYRLISFAVTILVLVVAVSILVAQRLQRVISNPLQNILKLIERVQNDRNYAIEISSSGAKEICGLVDGINEMLKEIHITNIEKDRLLKRMEDLNSQLRNARDEALQFSKAKSDFLSRMSHEIRTPLNGIMGMTNLVLDSSLADDQRQNLNIVKSSSEMLLSIVNDILDFSKIEAGNLELDVAPFDISEHLRSIKRNFSVQSEAKGVNFSASIDDNLPPRILGDSRRMGQIMFNLIGNAIKFTEAGGRVTFNVQLMSHTTTGTTVKFEVSDTGQGIKKEELDSIFTLAQTTDSSSNRFSSVGLGLSIVSRLVEMMDGELDVESDFGKGSTFSVLIRFPAVESWNPTHETHEELNGTGELQDAESYKPLRILLVEDNPVNCKLAVRLLEKQGHHVWVVGNGLRAIDMLGHRSFDLILMDIHMPVLDGLEATKRIREMENSELSQIPIVAMTAHAVEGYREMCHQAGMDDYITKPINVKELNNVLVHYSKKIHSSGQN